MYEKRGRGASKVTLIVGHPEDVRMLGRDIDNGQILPSEKPYGQHGSWGMMREEISRKLSTICGHTVCQNLVLTKINP